nr:MAG TPA: hypothetical protein [Caudoviricetes sp.]
MEVSIPGAFFLSISDRYIRTPFSMWHLWHLWHRSFSSS